VPSGAARAVAHHDDQQAGGDERDEAEVHRLGQDRQAGRQPEPTHSTSSRRRPSRRPPRDHDGRQQHAERIARHPHPVEQEQRLRGDDEPDQGRVARAPDDPARPTEQTTATGRAVSRRLHQPQAATEVRRSATPPRARKEAARPTGSRWGVLRLIERDIPLLPGRRVATRPEGRVVDRPQPADLLQRRPRLRERDRRRDQRRRDDVSRSGPPAAPSPSTWTT
jgi:hypothetical protein